jgi:hypothetical protein
MATRRGARSELLRHPDPAGAAIMPMKKLDIATLAKAFEGA